LKSINGTGFPTHLKGNAVTKSPRAPS